MEAELEAERAAGVQLEKKREELRRNLEEAETLNTKRQEELERCQKTILDLQNDKQQSDQKIREQQVFILSMETFINVCSIMTHLLVQCSCPRTMEQRPTPSYF